jgi:hypothetical protein
VLRKPSSQQTALEMVSLDGLVPKNYLPMLARRGPQNIKKIALAMQPTRSPQPPDSRPLKLPTSKTKPAENRRVYQRSQPPRRRLFNSNLMIAG